MMDKGTDGWIDERKEGIREEAGIDGERQQTDASALKPQTHNSTQLLPQCPTNECTRWNECAKTWLALLKESSACVNTQNKQHHHLELLHFSLIVIGFSCASCTETPNGRNNRNTIMSDSFSRRVPVSHPLWRTSLSHTYTSTSHCFSQSERVVLIFESISHCLHESSELYMTVWSYSGHTHTHGSTWLH